MSEKKIFSVDVAMDEPMFKALKGLAKADGTNASELIRMLVSTMIEERQSYYARLHSIFGDDLDLGNRKRSGSDRVGMTRHANPPRQQPSTNPFPHGKR